MDRSLSVESFDIFYCLLYGFIPGLIPQAIRTFTFISIMENKESYQNILLDNQETPIKITLSSTPEIKVTNKNLDIIDNNKNGPANDSNLKKMEEYISQ